MTPDWTELAKLAVQALTAGVTVFLAMKRYINGGIVRIETKLDDHSRNIDTAVGNLTEEIGAVRTDIAGVKGYLGIGMPPRNLH